MVSFYLKWLQTSVQPILLSNMLCFGTLRFPLDFPYIVTSHTNTVESLIHNHYYMLVTITYVVNNIIILNKYKQKKNQNLTVRCVAFKFKTKSSLHQKC